MRLKSLTFVPTPLQLSYDLLHNLRHTRNLFSNLQYKIAHSIEDSTMHRNTFLAHTPLAHPIDL